MDVCLVMFKADGTRRDFPVSKPRIVIGRTNTCDLRIPVSSVSRQHCEVLVDDADKSVRVRDLGSSNGTYHNSVRVQQATVKAGDEVVIGPVVFTIVVDGQPSRIEPTRTIMDEASAEGVTPSPTLQPKSADDSAVPQALEASDDDLPAFVESESHSPTVDLDDPIAALEALAQAEADETKPKGK
jgi:predicted component of type VI protein secretion system